MYTNYVHAKDEKKAKQLRIQVSKHTNTKYTFGLSFFLCGGK